MRITYLFIFAFTLILTGFAHDASAAQGYANNELKVRAGPNSEYPVVSRIADNRLLDIRGCTDGWKWCEVSARGSRGWVPADQLRVVYQNKRVQLKNYGERLNVPVVGFERRNYWRQNYRDRDFYRNEANWDHYDRDSRHDNHRHDNGNHYGQYKDGKVYYRGPDGEKRWTYTDQFRSHGDYSDYKNSRYGYNR